MGVDCWIEIWLEEEVTNDKGKIIGSKFVRHHFKLFDTAMINDFDTLPIDNSLLNYRWQFALNNDRRVIDQQLLADCYNSDRELYHFLVKHKGRQIVIRWW